MKEQVKKLDPSKEYYFHEGCFITEYSNGVDDQQCSIARARVEAGKVTKWHSLEDTTERYVIVTGTGLVDVGDDTSEQVASGDVVIIPAGVRQRIANNGNEDLVFLAICTPRFQAENYTDLE
ncbi:MAG: mannose-6-phosphate isomerase-like protein (cupin superfamily) [Chitinophagales bacterium]|jgi:mannose-6-phosphate isomerase-like protein (cupin superfamily)